MEMRSREIPEMYRILAVISSSATRVAVSQEIFKAPRVSDILKTQGKFRRYDKS